jgi:hypothetical protein
MMLFCLRSAFGRRSFDVSCSITFADMVSNILRGVRLVHGRRRAFILVAKLLLKKFLVEVSSDFIANFGVCDRKGSILGAFYARLMLAATNCLKSSICAGVRTRLGSMLNTRAP